MAPPEAHRPYPGSSPSYQPGPPQSRPRQYGGPPVPPHGYPAGDPYRAHGYHQDHQGGPQLGKPPANRHAPGYDEDDLGYPQRRQREGQRRPAPPRSRFGALAWSSLILGIVGVIGSPIILLNNLTAVVAAVGVILGVIALFGTKKVLAGIGVVLGVAGIIFTVMAQSAAVAAFDEALGDLGGGTEGLADVAVADCSVVDDGYGLIRTQGSVTVVNSTDTAQSYAITVSVNDASGDRIGEINAFVNSLAAGQSVALGGDDAFGLANEGAPVGPAACQVADVTRIPS